MKKAKRIFTLIAAIVMILSLCGCGNRQYSISEDSYESYPAAGYNSNSYNGVAVAAEDFGGLSAASTFSTKEKISVPEPAEYEEFDYPLDNDAPIKEQGQEKSSEKIIYSANATIETTAFDDTLEALRKMIEKFGGWVESSSTNASSYKNIQRGNITNRMASYTIRIPGENFDVMMSSLSNLGNVPFSSIYTENVTSQYYDTQARLKTYEAQEKRLIELLDMAENVSDVIEIENELTEVRYKIESMQTMLQGWDRRVDYSTIYLDVNEVSEYTPEQKPGYGSRIIKSLKDGFRELGEFLIDFIGALPILIVLAAVVWLAIIFVKKLIRAGKTKREKNNSKKEKTSE